MLISQQPEQHISVCLVMLVSVFAVHNELFLQPMQIVQSSSASPPISPLLTASGSGGALNVPSEWICPLSNKIMNDPVTGS